MLYFFYVRGLYFTVYSGFSKVLYVAGKAGIYIQYPIRERALQIDKWKNCVRIEELCLNRVKNLTLYCKVNNELRILASEAVQPTY